MIQPICEKCYEIVDSVMWSYKDQLICINCELGQTIESEMTPEKENLLKLQHQHFEQWKKETFSNCENSIK